MGLIAPWVSPAIVSGANIQNSLCDAATTQHINDKPEDCKTSTSGSESHFQKVLARIINIFSLIVGVVAVIMIIFGGFKYITSGGEPEKIKTAKQALVYALIGLIIVALAQIIVKFVLNQAAKT